MSDPLSLRGRALSACTDQGELVVRILQVEAIQDLVAILIDVCRGACQLNGLLGPVLRAGHDRRRVVVRACLPGGDVGRPVAALEAIHEVLEVSRVVALVVIVDALLLNERGHKTGQHAQAHTQQPTPQQRRDKGSSDRG
jgi:hypothetical protein